MWARLSRDDCDLILTTPGDLPAPAEDTVAALRALPEPPEVVLLTDLNDPAERAKLLAVGALGVIHADLPDTRLRRALEALLRRRREAIHAHAEAARARLSAQLGDSVSESLPMRQLVELARRVAPADTSLLILGETGAGKEWLARTIHAESPRRRGPFVPVNCVALPEGLLESELFGHVQGAFTGALRSRRGQFELAHRGTLFLDEIGEMPLSLQAKLLRALQDRRIQPLGGEREISVDVRVMAATNLDLAEAMAAKAFRPDLYYRLGVITLIVPPLRDRPEDIPALAQMYAARFAIQFGHRVPEITDAAMDALSRYAWPGNVRELINMMERAVLLGGGADVRPQDLPASMTGTPESFAWEAGEPSQAWTGFDRPLAEARDQLVERFERAYLIRTLESCAGRVGEAAERAGISPRSLYNKLRRYGIQKESYRTGRRPPH